MEDGVPAHFHKFDRIEERDLIPNGLVLSALPVSGIEGERCVVLSGSTYSFYQYLGGAWQQIGGITIPLPISQGGTGATSAAAALSALGAAAASHTHAASDIVSGLLAAARLGSGTADSTKFLRGDQTWTVISAAQDTIGLVAGENLTIRDSVFVASGAADASVLSVSSPGSNQAFGQTSAQKAAQSFQLTSEELISKVTLRLKSPGGASDNVVVTLRDNKDGTVLATGTITGSSITTSFANYTATFTTPYVCAASTTYWIQVERSGALNDSFYYQWERGTASTYASGQGESYDSIGGWSGFGSGIDYTFSFTATTVAGKVYRTRASLSGWYENYIGVMNASALLAQTATVKILGVMTGFSSLTPGATYFLSNTRGTISTTAGTNVKVAGFAMSATELLIQNNSNITTTSGATTHDATGTTSNVIPHGLGGVPKAVRITAVNNDGFAMTTYNGATGGSVYKNTGSNMGAGGAGLRIGGAGNSGIYSDAAITVDATNITLTWTRTGADTGTVYLMWEASV